tara:strand:+ start:13199 stop:14491 length:1293 start_codon:yes stop_codon:yes gene_type:complete
MNTHHMPPNHKAGWKTSLLRQMLTGDDIATFKANALKVGVHQYGNFSQSMKGLEQHERKLKSSARSFLPAVRQGHLEHSSEFLHDFGMVSNELYYFAMVNALDPALKDSLTAAVASAEKHSEKVASCKTQDELIAYCTDRLGHIVANPNNKEGPRFVNAMLERRFGSIANYIKFVVPDPCDAEIHRETLRGLLSWACLHRNYIAVDPVTSTKLHETEPPTDVIIARDIAQYLPNVILHDGALGVTAHVTCCWPSGFEPSVVESVDDIDYMGVEMTFWYDNTKRATCFIPDGEAPRFSGPQSDDVMRMIRWTQNAFMLAHSYPTYLRELPSRKNASLGKKLSGNSSCKSIELSQPVSSKTLMQIVNESDTPAGAGLGGTMSQHWRKGHWRRQFHGKRWELLNPDQKVTVCKKMNKRYHYKWIMPILINRDK